MSEFDPGTASSARIYNYWLGGKDNFDADRAAADALAARFPSTRQAAWANRRFMHRAVGWLTALGVRQFLDLGTGIPLSPNVHDIAQEAHRDARVVYVDNDPVVLTHARALMPCNLAGTCHFVNSDLSRPSRFLAHPALDEVLDWTRPVGVLAIAVAHFLPHDVPDRLIGGLRARMAPGSYLAASHYTTDMLSPADAARAADATAEMGTGLVARTREQFAALFDGMMLLDAGAAPRPRRRDHIPGIVPVHRWRPDPADGELRIPDADISMWAAVGHYTGAGRDD